MLATKSRRELRTERQSIDRKLRAHGYRIVSRPDFGSVTWMNEDREVITQAKALALIEEWEEMNAVT